MTVSGDDVYVGSSLGIVQKGDATTGGFQFWGTCGGPVNSLAIDATHLNLGTTSGQIYRLDLATQNVTQTYTVASDAEAMILHEDDLVIGGSNAQILRVRRTDGQVKSTIPAQVAVSALAALPESEPGTVYCYGVGCPCGNNDPSGGCRHSRRYGGRLAGSGSTSVAADDLELFAFVLPPNRNGRFYMSQNTTQLAFGDGLLCAGSGGYPLFRFPFENSGSTASLRLPPNLVAYCGQHFPGTGQIFPGSTWNFQVWFRDPVGPCGGFFNTTNSYAVAFSN
jgi:hypothetical protein